ncbi:MAG: hypothetical protein KGI38_12450, partial [Thaumarchaeota archaeon]|nr:hypothetical protein [Nitrososphaerota archaeon]
MQEKLLAPNTPENPYSVPVMVITEGPTRKIFCQVCPANFQAPLEEARVKLLTHYRDKHPQKPPRIHSFLKEEDPFDVNIKLLQLLEGGLV